MINPSQALQFLQDSLSHRIDGHGEGSPASASTSARAEMFAQLLSPQANKTSEGDEPDEE